MVGRERDRHGAVSFEQEACVDEHHAYDRTRFVVVHRVSFGGRDSARRGPRDACAEVQHVATPVVLVVIERGSGDGDVHGSCPGSWSWTNAVTTKAGDSLKSTTTLYHPRGSRSRR